MKAHLKEHPKHEVLVEQWAFENLFGLNRWVLVRRYILFVTRIDEKKQEIRVGTRPL